jgi:hypothetical protein
VLGRADVRVQLPFSAGDDSLPEPDLALVEPGSFGQARPQRTFLIIQVSKPSLAEDRSEKAPLYAAAGVPENVDSESARSPHRSARRTESIGSLNCESLCVKMTEMGDYVTCAPHPQSRAPVLAPAPGGSGLQRRPAGRTRSAEQGLHQPQGWETGVGSRSERRRAL